MLDQVKEFLEIEDNSKDSKLTIYIKTAISSIKNYLNNDNFDDEYIENNFATAVILMVSNAYEAKNTNSVGGNVKSMTQGSRSIEYFDKTSLFSISDNEEIKALLPKPYIKTFY